MERPSVNIEGATIQPLLKPVSEMTNEEKEKAAKEIVEHVQELEQKQAVGKNQVYEISVDWEEYQGIIKMRHPSLDDERKIGLRAEDYLQGRMGTDPKTANLATFFAAFDVLVDWKSAPEWFVPREMPANCYSLMEFIYGRYAEWQNTFRRFVPAKSETNSGTPGSKA